MKRTLAAADLALVAPGIVFFVALFLRNFLPADAPANGAQSVVRWYAGHHWTLWTLLIVLPLSALLLGGTALWRIWNTDDTLRDDARRVLRALRPHLPVLLTGIATIAAATVLFLVGLHMAAN